MFLNAMRIDPHERYLHALFLLIEELNETDLSQYFSDRLTTEEFKRKKQQNL